MIYYKWQICTVYHCLPVSLYWLRWKSVIYCRYWWYCICSHFCSMLCQSYAFRCRICSYMNNNCKFLSYFLHYCFYYKFSFFFTLKDTFSWTSSYIQSFNFFICIVSCKLFHSFPVYISIVIIGWIHRHKNTFKFFQVYSHHSVLSFSYFYIYFNFL